MSKIITNEDRFTVIKDTREKKPWAFDPDDYCLGSVSEKLDTGDYSIKGFEREIVIERKRNTAEISQNIYEKRFEKELYRLEEFSHPYMILEFNWNDVLMFPVGSSIPEKLWHKLNVRGEHLEKALTRYMLKFKTKLIFAGKFGEKVTYNLFKYFTRMKNGNL